MNTIKVRKFLIDLNKNLKCVLKKKWDGNPLPLYKNANIWGGTNFIELQCDTDNKVKLYVLFLLDSFPSSFVFTMNRSIDDPEDKGIEVIINPKSTEYRNYENAKNVVVFIGKGFLTPFLSILDVICGVFRNRSIKWYWSTNYIAHRIIEVSIKDTELQQQLHKNKETIKAIKSLKKLIKSIKRKQLLLREQLLTLRNKLLLKFLQKTVDNRKH